jgi:hypothetical protein
MKKPSLNHDRHGRFTPGNQAGKGNPLASRAQEIRVGVYAASDIAEVRKIVKSLIRAAKNGDLAAAKYILDRLLGPPVPLDMLERLEALESRLLSG